MVKVVRNRSKTVSFVFCCSTIYSIFIRILDEHLARGVFWRDFGLQKSARERYIDKTSK